MRRFTQILILLVIGILLLPFFLPKQLNAEVEKEFDSPPGIIFEEFNNLKEFSEWDPWSSSDSLTTQEFFAPYRGMGAGYKWKSIDSEAEITINKSDINKTIIYALDGLNLGENAEMKVNFQSSTPNKTKVKWSIITEEIGYFSRYYSYFTSKKLTEKLQLGLSKLEANLKSSALTPEQAISLAPGMIKTEIFEGQKLITVMNETSLEKEEMETASEESFGLIYSYLVDFLKISPTKIGSPVTYFEYVDLAAKKAKFYSGFPISESVKLGEGMELMALPATETLVCIHKGNHTTIQESISKMKDFAKKNNLKLENSHWEVFQNDPKSTPKPEELLTKIYIPIKK